MRNTPTSTFLKFRSDFPIFKQKMHGKPLIYLDSAATAQKPQIVIDAICDYYQNHYGTVNRAVYELSVEATRAYQATREKARDFLNARSSEEIIFTRGTTESINLVAYSFGKAFIKPGDEVLITEMEHHANIVPWQILCEDRGAILRVVPFNDRGELDIEAYHKHLSKKTKIVAFTHISNALGTLNPAKELVKIAHDAGAKVLIDGAQAAPHLPIDVQDLDADFYVISGHKIYGPTGVGVLFGKRELLEAMPPYQGGGDMIDAVTFEKTTYQKLPLKFEAGTPMIAEVIGLGAAFDYLEHIGIDNVYHHEHELLQYATKSLQEMPEVTIIGNAKEKGSIISFIVEGIHHLDIGTMLDLKGIAIRTGHHCAQPSMNHYKITGTARLSLGLYNTFEDLEAFSKALKDVIKMF